MSAMKFAGSVLVGTILSASCLLAADCAKVQNANAPQLIAFLNNAKNAEPDCVREALSRLGDLREASGTSVLITFLAFQRPMSIKENAGLGDLHDRYPAVPALFSIGTNAIPKLVDAIASRGLKELETRNAIRATSLIYRDTPLDAIRVFQKAVVASTDADTKRRLEQAAQAAADLCSSSWHEQCKHQLVAPSAER